MARTPAHRRGRNEDHRLPRHARHARLSRSSKSAWRSAASAAPPPAGSRSTTCSCRKENILGPLGKGLRVALTVLDFGRTTFGASCTGAAKFCVAAVGRPRQQPRAVRRDARRVRTGEREDRLHAGRRVRDGSRTYQTARAHRLRRQATTCSRRRCSRSSPPTCSGRSSTTPSRSTAARPTSPTSRSSG